MQGWIHFTTAKPVTFLLSTFLGTSSAVNFSFAQWPNLSKQFSMILSSWDNSNTLSNCQALWLLMEGPFVSHKRSAWWRRGEQRNRPTEVWFSSCWRTERKSQPKHFPETSTSLALKPSLSESYTCKIWQSTFNFPNSEQNQITSDVNSFPVSWIIGVGYFQNCYQRRKRKEFNIITLVTWSNGSVQTFSTCPSSFPSSHASSPPWFPEQNLLIPKPQARYWGQGG